MHVVLTFSPQLTLTAPPNSLIFGLETSKFRAEHSTTEPCVYDCGLGMH